MFSKEYKKEIQKVIMTIDDKTKDAKVQYEIT